MRCSPAIAPPDPSVAVRSSATAEDLPEASFAGQQETYLGVRGADALVDACRRCFASLFTDRAIVYRIQHGFDHLAVRLSIGVQHMVRADLGAAGVMFTLDPESGSRDVVVINSAYGLGEAVVQGQLDPDEFWVFKPTLRAGHHAILKRALRPEGLEARARRRRHADEGRRAGRGALVPEPGRCRGARAGASRDRDRSSLLGEGGSTRRRWTSSGRATARTGASTSSRRARRRSTGRSAGPSIQVFTLGPTAGFERLVSGKAIGQRVGVGRARRLRGPRDLACLAPG